MDKKPRDILTLAWYEQRFFQDKLGLLFGVYNYNSEFYALDYASIFLNSSFGIGAEVDQTGPSIFPTTSLALRLQYQPTPNVYALATVYDGIPGDPNHPRRTSFQLRPGDGLFYGVEVGTVTPTGQAGVRHYKLALGGWYHDTGFTDFNGRRRSHNRGIYAIGELSLFQEADPAQGLGIFGQLGFTDPARNQLSTYIGAGVTYTGLIPGRDGDVVGLAMAHARNSAAFRRARPGSERAETALELLYRAHLLPGLILQPDLQYVINPGTDPTVDHAFVATLRVRVSL